MSLNTGNAILSNAITVDSNYNLGIGTTSTSSESNIFLGAKSTLEGGQLTLQKGTTQTLAAHLDNYSDRFRIMKGTDTGSTAELMCVNLSSGNVGIGTTSPNTRLHVAADGAYSSNWDAAQLWVTGTDTAKRLQLGYDTTNGYSIVQSIHGGVSVKPLLLNPQGGNVLIGTTNTANGHKLEIIAGSQSALRIDVTSGYSAISMSPGAIFGIDKPGVGGGTFKIDSTGYVGVNNSSPGARFIINGGGGSETSFQLNDGSSRRVFCIPSQYYGYIFAVSVASDGGKAISIGNGGGASEVGSIVANNASTTYNTTSDYRLKEDFKDFSGLEKVSNIKVYDFKWKTNDERTHGVIAHELAEVLPYAVHGEKDGLDRDGKPSYQGVDYSKIVPSLVKAIQELSAKLTDQQQQINQLINK